MTPSEIRPVALITGAASGIGAAAAKAFAREGYAVALGDLSADGLKTVETSILENGGIAARTVVDVRDDASVRAFVNTSLKQFGRLDVVCPNAGVFIPPEAPLEQITDEAIDALLGVNLRGVIYVLRAALPSVSDNGSIILTSSISGMQSHPGGAVYAATKIAMVGLGRCLAHEVKSRHIRVNMICPGAVNTPLTRNAYPDTWREEIATAAAANPMGRIAEPEDIAEAFVFLASSAARHINGVALRVDGGDCLLGAI